MGLSSPFQSQLSESHLAHSEFGKNSVLTPFFSAFIVDRNISFFVLKSPSFHWLSLIRGPFTVTVRVHIFDDFTCHFLLWYANSLEIITCRSKRVTPFPFAPFFHHVLIFYVASLYLVDIPYSSHLIRLTNESLIIYLSGRVRTSVAEIFV